MFEGCTSLESIPENFFEKNIKVTEVSGLFTECTEAHDRTGRDPHP